MLLQAVIMEKVSEPMPKKAKASGVPQTALVKTVRKWEKELEIELGKEHNDDGVVEKIWCVVCKQFGRDRSSTVSIVSLLTLTHGLQFIGGILEGS